MDEYLSLYKKGEQGEMIASPEKILRGDPVPEGRYALGVAVFVANHRGELMATLRAPEKKSWPNYWENSGGGARYGETPVEAIQRELYEETGIRAETEEFIPLRTFWIDSIREVMTIFILCKDVSLSDVVLQKEETTDVKWCSITEYDRMAADGEIAGPIKEKYDQLRDIVVHWVEMWRQ